MSETLAEIVARLDGLDPEATIYAIEPWSNTSAAIVELEPDAGGVPEAAVRQGMRYFIEVAIARDFVADWLAMNRDVQPSSVSVRLIHYAMNDA